MADPDDGWEAWRATWRPLRCPDALAGDTTLEAHVLEPLDPTHAAMLRARAGARNRHLWTLLDGDGLSLVVCPEYHIVDRMGYILTERAHDGCGTTPALVLGDPEISVVPEEMTDQELSQALEDYEDDATKPGEAGRIGSRNLDLVREEFARRRDQDRAG